MVASSRRPWSHAKLIEIVRKIYRKASSLFSLTLKSVKAHAGIPGNEAADTLSKAFSIRSMKTDVNLNLDEDIPYYRHERAWPYGPPFSTLPLNVFHTPSFPPSPNGVLPAADSKTKKKPDPDPAVGAAIAAPLRRSARFARRASEDNFLTDAIVSRSLEEPLDFKHDD